MQVLTIDVQFRPHSKTRPERWTARIAGHHGSTTRPHQYVLDVPTNARITAALYADKYFPGAKCLGFRELEATHHQVMIQVPA